MEGYFKWFFIGHFLILIILAGISIYTGLSLVAIIATALLFEFLLYLLDGKYLSKRKAELAGKLTEVFHAEPVSEGVMKFKIDTIDFFCGYSGGSQTWFSDCQC